MSFVNLAFTADILPCDKEAKLAARHDKDDMADNHAMRSSSMGPRAHCRIEVLYDTRMISLLTPSPPSGLRIVSADKLWRSFERAVALLQINQKPINGISH